MYMIYVYRFYLSILGVDGHADRFTHCHKIGSMALRLAEKIRNGFLVKYIDECTHTHDVTYNMCIYLMISVYIYSYICIFTYFFACFFHIDTYH